jgi:hypothetical protein
VCVSWLCIAYESLGVRGGYGKEEHKHRAKNTLLCVGWTVCPGSLRSQNGCSDTKLKVDITFLLGLHGCDDGNEEHKHRAKNMLLCVGWTVCLGLWRSQNGCSDTKIKSRHHFFLIGATCMAWIWCFCIGQGGQLAHLLPSKCVGEGCNFQGGKRNFWL